MVDTPRRFPHIIVKTSARTERYTNPSIDHPEVHLKPRDRQAHGLRLKKQLEAALKVAEERLRQIPREEQVLPGATYIEFESDPGFELNTKSLSDRKHGIELVAVSVPEPDDEAGAPMRATVLVPEGKETYLMEKIDQYLNKDTKTKQPCHKNLIESIGDIEPATLRSLWTDSGKLPAQGKIIWWEVWLRAGQSDEERTRILALFRARVLEQGMEVSRNEIPFPESTVLLLRASARQIEKHLMPLNVLAEIRRVRETADFFTSMRPKEQAERVREALAHVTPPGPDAPAVCLLDTGVYMHPLLAPGLDALNVTSYNKSWGSHDHHGHGTEMAGLGLYGDLVELLTSNEHLPLTHRIESVKILPPSGENPPPLYGEITKECVARAEVSAPERNRAICLAVTTDASDRGKPSSWSAAVDQLCAGTGEEGETQRLVLVSAGNALLRKGNDYPNANYIEGIQDPGHAWNAITVGA
jgi:Subtilase family